MIRLVKTRKNWQDGICSHILAQQVDKLDALVDSSLLYDS
jgi:hypothetical protein